MLVVQALYRRLVTPRGTLRRRGEALAYGIDLAGYLGSLGSRTAVAAMPSQIQAELLKDDRVSSIEVTVTPSAVRGEVALTVEIVGVLIDEAETFGLTLSVTEARTTLLRVA